MECIGCLDGLAVEHPECGHAAMCSVCVREFSRISTAGSRCAICRRPVISVAGRPPAEAFGCAMTLLLCDIDFDHGDMERAISLSGLDTELAAPLHLLNNLRVEKRTVAAREARLLMCALEPSLSGEKFHEERIAAVRAMIGWSEVSVPWRGSPHDLEGVR